MNETVVCVGAVVEREGGVLLVRQALGHQLEGQWTIPWGLLEAGESPSTAVVREVEEETGVEVDVKGLLGVQELPPPWEGWVALVYLCRYLGGQPRPDGRETDAARFFSTAELRSLTEPVEKWCYWLAVRTLSGTITVTRSDPENPYRPNKGFL